MRAISAACCCLLLPAALAPAQQFLDNRGFQGATLSPWVQLGSHGGTVTAATGFGIVPTQNDRAWATVYNNEAGGAGVWEGVYQTVPTVGPGTYLLQVDVLAHNRSDGFIWVPGQASSVPGDTIVRFGYDLTGGTNPNAGSVVLTPPMTTGAQFRRQQLQFTKGTPSSTITVFLLTESKNPYAGNWAAFDNARLDNVTACAAPITVTGSSPSSLSTPPSAGVQAFTITGTNLNLHDGVANLFGPEVINGTIVSTSPTELTVNFDLTGAIAGVYDLIIPHVSGDCRPGTRSGAFTLECTCPPTTVSSVLKDYGLSGSMHTLTLVGSNIQCLTGVKLRKSRDGGAEINATSLTPNGPNLDVTFNLAGAEGGRYDLLFTHPCQQLTPAQGMPEGFLVYLPEIANGSFEEGWAADATTGSVCANPAANGNRPKARHWDEHLIAASAFPGSIHHKRDGNVWFPECINGRVKNLTGDHYNGIDVHTDATNPANTVSFFQTIAAPHVDPNGVSTLAFNVRAELAINGANGAFPAVAEIRLYDGTEASGTLVGTSGVISSRFESNDDFGLISDPGYNAIAAAGTIYTSNPPLLTIEFRMSTNVNTQSGTQVGFWVDNVRTGPYVPPGCSATVWADADEDGDVDLDDFGVWQLCHTGASEGLPSEPEYCHCLDRALPENVIDTADLVEFAKCASGARVPWSPLVAPNCTP